MNAAAEVLRLRHWPPRGVYTRWRPRKRFAPASCVYHQHLQESYPLAAPPSVQNWTFVPLFLFLAKVLISYSTRLKHPTLWCVDLFQIGNLAVTLSFCDGMAPPVMSCLRASLRVRILTPGHRKGGRVARYFLLSLALNSSCENRATGVQSRLSQLRFG